MEVTKTARGFEVIDLATRTKTPGSVRLLQQSSAVGDYADSLERPGSSYLWLGESHHLDREDVAQLVTHLQAWLATGSLKIN